jgi:hypothetical protein
VRWDGNNDLGHAQASGMYVYRLRTSDSSLSRKMVLAR